MLHGLFATAHKLTHWQRLFRVKFSAPGVTKGLRNSHLFKESHDVFVTLLGLIREDFDFLLEGKMKNLLLRNISSDPQKGLVGLWCPTEATDMSFQRLSACDRTPLEFRGTPALPALIIGPFTVIPLLSE